MNEVRLALEFPVLLCSNERCDMKFIFCTVIEEDDGNQDMYPQERAHFCPYCGMKQP